MYFLMQKLFGNDVESDKKLLVTPTVIYDSLECMVLIRKNDKIHFSVVLICMYRMLRNNLKFILKTINS